MSYLKGLPRDECERCSKKRAEVELIDGNKSIGKYCRTCGAIEKARYDANPLKLRREKWPPEEPGSI